MKIITLNLGNNIDNYESVSSNYLKLLRTEKPTNIGMITIDCNGVLGYHQAPVPQLFIVVNGEGWIKGENQIIHTITSGQAVFFEKGEWHETGSACGLTAFIFQSQNLRNPFI